MRGLLLCALLAGLLASCQAGSGKDVWGIDTLVNYPPGETRKEVPVQAGDDGVIDPIQVTCQCSDADPRGELSQEVEVGCFMQRYYNKCSEAYMFDANAELAPEGFCQISCSRCSCCQDPAAVLQGLGATRFLQALEATQPSLKELLTHPGYTATILAPTDAAFDAALSQFGPLLQSPALLTELLKFHVVPPEPVRRGLWTSPLLSVGPTLYTLYDGPETLRVPKFPLPANATWEGGIAGWTVQGPYNSAKVVQSDVPACKSLVTLVDAVLLPFDPTAAPRPDATAAAAALGVKGAVVQPNALIKGDTLTAGDANRKASIGECAAACAAATGCNAFHYCSQKGGCHMPGHGAPTLKYGHCALLRSAELAAGQPAAWEDWSAVTVPLASGYLQPTVQAAAGTAGRRLF